MDDFEDKGTDSKLQIALFFLTIIILLASIYYAYIILNISDNNNFVYHGSPGDFAKIYLQDDEYDEIFIEVDYMEGVVPTNVTMDNLIDALTEVCDKNNISYQLSDMIKEADQSEVYPINTIGDLEESYRDYQNSDNTAVIYILYLNGRFEGGSDTLGISYSASSFAIFQEQIEDVSIPTVVRRYVSTQDFENSVVIHEAGHLLGLVNINYESSIDHEDNSNDSPHHCINEECVMYYALEHSRQGFMEKLWQREDLKPPKTFGEYCTEDLEKLKNDIY